MAATPLVSGLRALGPEGPFAASSQPKWSCHRGGIVRDLDLAAYGTAMRASGVADWMVDRLVARLEQAGCARILWACGHGGGARGGQVNAIWDVRVVASDEAAALLAADIATIGDARYAGAERIDELAGLPGVLETSLHPYAPSTVPIAREQLPWWGRLARLKLEVRYDHEWLASATLASGNVGVDICTTARSRLAAVEALGRLVEVVRTDLDEHRTAASA